MLRTKPTIALLAAAGLWSGAAAAQEAAPAKGAPADLCAELLAFVKPPEAPPQPAAAPPQQATAVSAPAGKDAAQPSAQPSSVAGETQQKSGLSGPVPASGPSSPPTFGQRMASANAEAKGAPPPGTPKPPPKPDEAMVAKVEAAAAGGDAEGCRAAAQTMRKAGIALPAPLLALAALDPRLRAQ